METTAITTKEDIRDFFERSGVSLTKQRIDIGYLLLTENQHLSTSELIDLINSKLPYVSRATIFNTINLFLKHGLIRKFDIQSGSTIYDTNGHPHHHVLDEESGKIYDVFLDPELEEEIVQKVRGSLPEQVMKREDVGRVMITLPI